MTDLELQRMFLDSPFEMSDFSKEELEKIKQTKQIRKEPTKTNKKIKIKINKKDISQI